jgi:NTP pyrophosphatase (non-canonical NTP hydrolase)
MTTKEYQELVSRTMNGDLTYTERLSMLCMGLSGESGELIDAFKKNLYHGHAISFDYVQKEIGDILWYIASLCNEFNFDMGDIMQKNIDKLKKRYPEGFDAEKSINRAE